jgi:hypothetical protein
MLAGNGVRGASRCAGTSTNTTNDHVRFHVAAEMRARFLEASRTAMRHKLRGNRNWRGATNTRFEKSRARKEAAEKQARQKAEAAAVNAIDRKNKAESKQGARTDLAEKKEKPGPASNFGNNIPEVKGRPEGTSLAKALRRLRKDKPELHPTNSDRPDHADVFDQDTFGSIRVRKEAEALVAMCASRQDIPAIRASILMESSHESCLRKNGIPASRNKKFRERVLRMFDELAERDFETIQRRANRIRAHIRRREAIEHKVHAEKERARRNLERMEEAEEAWT